MSIHLYLGCSLININYMILLFDNITKPNPGGLNWLQALARSNLQPITIVLKAALAQIVKRDISCLTHRACTLKRSTSTSLLSIQPCFCGSTNYSMSVLLETSAGDITIDLLVKEAPKCCEK
jgi:hypothetical protein